MKKRMFLSTILMTLVLLLAVTTATFAWYAASTGTVSKTGDTATITTSGTTVELGAITLKFDLGTPTENVGPTSAEDGHAEFTTAGDNITRTLAQLPYSAFGEVAVSASAVILVDDDDNDETPMVEQTADAELLQGYAGTYDFTVDSTDLRLTLTNPSTAGFVGDDQAITITVTITDDGLVQVSHNKVYFGVVETYTTKSGSITLTAVFAG